MLFDPAQAQAVVSVVTFPQDTEALFVTPNSVDVHFLLFCHSVGCLACAGVPSIA